MNRTELPETTLLALVDAVSQHAQNDAETVRVVGHLLSTHQFRLTDDFRVERFRRHVASLPTTH
jgi:hypothetical protein